VFNILWFTEEEEFGDSTDLPPPTLLEFIWALFLFEFVFVLPMSIIWPVSLFLWVTL
jgi:hypothetical protein